jgi:hypothetical protein
MPYFSPNTWTVLQAIQTRIQLDLTVNDSNHPVTAASPFTALRPDNGDNVFYAAPNIGATTPTAIFIGEPPEWQSSVYLRQCHIIPPAPESVARHALGGKIWDESHITVQFAYRRASATWTNSDQRWYVNMQDLLAARDAMQVLLAKHAELPNATMVQATKALPAGPISGLGHIDMEGDTWDLWSFVWWVRQEWTVQGGIVQ